MIVLLQTCMIQVDQIETESAEWIAFTSLKSLHSNECGFERQKTIKFQIKTANGLIVFRARLGTNSFQQMSANFTHFTAVKNFQKTSENFLLQLFSLK